MKRKPNTTLVFGDGGYNVDPKKWGFGGDPENDQQPIGFLKQTQMNSVVEIMVV